MARIIGKDNQVIESDKKKKKDRKKIDIQFVILLLSIVLVLGLGLIVAFKYWPTKAAEEDEPTKIEEYVENYNSKTAEADRELFDGYLIKSLFRLKEASETDVRYYVYAYNSDYESDTGSETCEEQALKLFDYILKLDNVKLYICDLSNADAFDDPDIDNDEDEFSDTVETDFFAFYNTQTVTIASPEFFEIDTSRTEGKEVRLVSENTEKDLYFDILKEIENISK